MPALGAAADADGASPAARLLLCGLGPTRPRTGTRPGSGLGDPWSKVRQSERGHSTRRWVFPAGWQVDSAAFNLALADGVSTLCQVRLTS